MATSGDFCVATDTLLPADGDGADMVFLSYVLAADEQPTPGASPLLPLEELRHLCRQFGVSAKSCGQ
jgi:hypothetical protein